MLTGFTGRATGNGANAGQSYSQSTRPYFSRGIEPRLQDGNQQFLPESRGRFAGAFVPLDPGYPVQQPDNASAESVRVGCAIAAQTLSEIFRFADVKHAFRGTAQEINCGAVGRLRKKFSPNRSTSGLGHGNSQS